MTQKQRLILIAGANLHYAAADIAHELGPMGFKRVAVSVWRQKRRNIELRFIQEADQVRGIAHDTEIIWHFGLRDFNELADIITRRFDNITPLATLAARLKAECK